MNRKHGAPNFKIRDFQFEVKEINEAGDFNGYASVFGVVDSYREVVAPGAFKKSLKKLKASKRNLPALWQHRSDEPVGFYSQLAEDDHGLLVEGHLMVEEIQKAREARALMKAKVVTGLSIGFYTIDDSWNDKERIRTLKEVELVEVSVVTFPANDDARIGAVKRKLAHGAYPTLPEFESILREAGFSKSQATLVANRGMKALLDRGEPEPSQSSNPGELLSLLQSISLT